MMIDSQAQMDKLKPGEFSAGCEACKLWLTTAGVDSGALNEVIKNHRKVHGGDEVRTKKEDGVSQVRFPMTVLFKCERGSGN